MHRSSYHDQSLNMAFPGAGGFIPYSPPPSSVASTSSPQTLPHPRSTPLKPGGSKESNFIRYVDQRILHIQRRFAKRDASRSQELGVKEIDEEGRMIEEIEPIVGKHGSPEEWNDVPGYPAFAEAARDVEELAGVVWVSGTPSLQIPYLISLALLTTSMIAAFSASPRQLFRLLGKLDHAFASLLVGRDVETDEPLPGLQGRRGVSVTEKVRIKSLVERTRICVVETMAKGEFEEEVQDADMDDEQDNLDGELIMDEDEVSDDWDMMVAKVYDKTLVELGDSMDGPAIGIRT